jgi:hypothetical protein
MSNWNLPGLTDLYTNFLAYLKSRDDDATRLNDTRVDNATNLPTYAKRWNDTTQTFQNWWSSAWSNLVLGIAGGGTGAATAATARTNLDVYSKAESDAAFATALTSASGDLSGDVALTTSEISYDGPSVSLVAGTWLIVGNVIVYKPGGGRMYVEGRIVSGSTRVAYSFVQMTTASGALEATLPLSHILIIGSTTTVKITAVSGTTGVTMLIGTTVRAVKIA